MASSTDLPKRVTISIRLSPDIWKQAKRVALEREVTLSQLVETAILREMRHMETQPGGK